MLDRAIWVLRGFIYRVFFGIHFVYLGRPIIIFGKRRIKTTSGLGIYPGARIEVGLRGRIIINRNVRVGHNFFCQTNSNILIGNNVTISANVFIGTTDYNWKSKDLRRLKFREEIEKPIVIGDGAFIGINATLLPGSILGKGCVVGANVVVKGVHPDYSIIT